MGNDLEPFIIGKCAERLGFDKYNDEITKVYAYEDLFEVSLDAIIFNDSRNPRRQQRNSQQIP